MLHLDCPSGQIPDPITQQCGEDCGKDICIAPSVCIDQRCEDGGKLCGEEMCLATQICINQRCKGKIFSYFN